MLFPPASNGEGGQDSKLPDQYAVLHWSVESGLPDNFISDILQTRDGYIWIATARGLCRFDGTTFESIDRRSRPLLLSNRISTLLEDRRETLWFGTHGGGLYALSADSIRRITQDDGLPSNFVLSLCEDPDGSLWVGTDGKGLGHILRDTIIAYSDTAGLLSRNVNALLYGADGVLWIGTTKGINLFGAGSLSVFPQNRLLPSLEIEHFFEDGETMWIATRGGLCTVRNGSVQSVPLPGGPVQVTSVTKDREGRIWIGTGERGVYRIDGTSIAGFTYGNPAKSGDVAALYSDKEGNIWIGTERAGLIRLRDEIFTPITTRDGLPDNFTTSGTEGRGGQIWVGTANGLACLHEGKVQTYLPGISPFDRLVQAVAVDARNVVWCGSRSGLLTRLEHDRPVPVHLPGPGSASVWAIYPDSRGVLWVGTRSGLYALKGGTFVEYRSRERYKGLSNDDVRAICEDRRGAMWFGTSYGLSELNSSKFTQYTWKTGLSNDVIISLFPDADGDLWVGTMGGLNRLRNGHSASITMEQGLPDDAIACIVGDDHGFLWLGTGNGICRIDKTALNAFLDGETGSLPIAVFGLADGLRSVKVRTGMQSSGWKASDGSLWFATDNGVARIDPGRVRVAPLPLAIHITRVLVDRQKKQPDKPLTLGSDFDELEITYSAPTFVKPEATAFRYMLKGLHTGWVDAGKRRSAFFSRIPPGEYTFLVGAGDGNGNWTSSEASLAISVTPPLWRTWWFRLLLVLAFLAVGPTIYFRRVRQLKLAQIQQQDFAARLIASQEAERKRIAAELHDSLGQNIIIIKNRALLGKQADEDIGYVSEQLDEIARTASTTLDEMRTIAHNLRPLNLDRFGLTETVAQTVKDVGSASGISLEADLEKIDGILGSDAEMHLFRVVQEGLNNIVKHAHATAGLVSIKKAGHAIRLTIRDNGTGFDPTGRFHKTGLGLDDIAQRVKLIGGKLTLESASDLGTTLHVTLPLPEKIS